MGAIREKIREFTDDFLLNQYHTNKQDYTAEAIACMEEEIAARKLAVNQLTTDTPEDTVSETEDLSRYLEEKFVPFDHGFYQTDLLLAGEMLRDAQIPFTLDTSRSSKALPIKNEGTRYYAIHVPESLLEKAQACVGRHFDAEDGHYAIKFADISERLKAFNFYEIAPLIQELTEEIDVRFSAQEAEAIGELLTRCENEAETIEQESGKMLFYYDNLSDCRNHVSDKKRTGFSSSDLLTILETMQVYCDRENYPHSLDSTAEVLLDFFNNIPIR